MHISADALSYKRSADQHELMHLLT